VTKQGPNRDEAGRGDGLPEGRPFPPVTERFPDPDQGPWQVTLDWSVIDGRIECHGMSLTSVTGGLLLPPSAVRDLRYGERVRRIRAALYAEHGGMSRSARARLVEAADVYREAFRAGRPPTKAVAGRFGLRRWVGRRRW
jgi:hypothetical protein